MPTKISDLRPEEDADVPVAVVAPTTAKGKQEAIWDKDELPDNLKDAIPLLQAIDRIVISPTNAREEKFLRKRRDRVGKRVHELQQVPPPPPYDQHKSKEQRNAQIARLSPRVMTER